MLKGTTGCIRTEVTRWAPPADVVLTTIAVESTGASSALRTALEVIAWRVSARRTREFCRPLGPSRTPVPTGTRLDGLATVSCTCNTCECLWAGKAVGTRYEAGSVWIPSPGRARMLGRVDCPCGAVVPKCTHLCRCRHRNLWARHAGGAGAALRFKTKTCVRGIGAGWASQRRR